MVEATQSLVAALLENQGYFVATDYKVKANDVKTYAGQSHDIDIDVIAIDTHNKKVLVAEVKSYWGSTGVRPEHVVDIWTDKKGAHKVLKILNNKDGIQEKLHGLLKRQIGEEFEFEYVLVAGRIRNKDEVEKKLAAKTVFGTRPRLIVIESLLKEFIESYRLREKRGFSYVNHPGIAAILALEEYNMLR